MNVRTFIAFVVMFLCIVPVAFSASIVDDKAKDVAVVGEVTQSAPAVVSVGNTICPVSGEAINEETKATYEHAGKVYNFCCASCIDDFKKDPEKYIKKVNEELSAESQKEKKEPAPHSGMSKDMQGGGQHRGH